MKDRDEAAKELAELEVTHAAALEHANETLKGADAEVRRANRLLDDYAAADRKLQIRRAASR